MAVDLWSLFHGPVMFYLFIFLVVTFVAAGLLALAKRDGWPCASGAFTNVVVLVRNSEGDGGGRGRGWEDRGGEAKGTVILRLV